ncbi:MAG: hypothetical protein Q8Q01_01530 [archaeon]|nr:hypothetical protein [archaeon]
MVIKRGSISRCNTGGFGFSSKKGQITIFIIIGIVILFTFAGILYFTSGSIQQKFTSEGLPILSSVPEEFRPVQSYTEQCVGQLAKRGLLILGDQGGYIYPELAGEFSSTNPTDSDGLNLEPLKVPYWHYNTPPNSAKNIAISSLKPEIKKADDPALSMESQLERFIDERIDGCLNDYAPFTSQGFDVVQDPDKTIKVTIGDGLVDFRMDMDVSVSIGDASTDLNVFFVRVPLDLRHYYEVAEQIANAEKEFNFLERQGLELISVYSRKDAQALPPTSDTGYQLFSSLSWQEDTVEQQYKGLLTSYVPMLRFLGSERFYYSTFPESERLAQHVVDNMVLPLSGADDVGVSFDYFGWNPYFKTNSEDGIIKPNSIYINYEILSFGNQQYETHYDVSYPVLVTIKDEAAFNGEGYRFVMALESNIRNNRPAEDESVREVYPKGISPISCDEAHRDTELLKTVVVDSFTKEPIEAVKIGFTIPDDQSCEMGLTDQSGELESKYPAVYGGVINFAALGYLSNFYPIDTYNYQDQPAVLGYAVANAPTEKVIEMDRIKTINVNIKKKPVQKCIRALECKYTRSGPTQAGDGVSFIPYSDISCSQGAEQCFFDSGSSVLGAGTPIISLEVNQSITKYNDYYLNDRSVDLRDDEEVLLTLERVSGFHGEVISNEFVASVAVKGSAGSNVQLVPGVYKISGFATTSQQVRIPAETRSSTYSILGYDKEEKFTLDESVSEGFVTGNIAWETPATYLTITPEQLYTADEITLYVPVQDIVSIPEQVKVPMKECGGYSCIPGVGCLFDVCKDTSVMAGGRIIEDMQISGLLGEVSRRPEVRASLEPTYTKNS